ncbi:MAG TPA: hypothetical protein VGS57_07350 [Thermoanaerobaculia bacterium]|nr:hypothetical protein [Thermoanaerobaculia bacterium]
MSEATVPPPAVRAEELRSREEAVGRWRLRLTSYRLGDEFLCVADNVDPGANVARARGASREEAEAGALARAAERLARTAAETARRTTAWLLAALFAVSASLAAQPLLFATQPGNGEVVAVDLAAGAVATTFAAGSLPSGAALSADGTRLYVADGQDGELRVFDTAGNALGSVAVGAGAAGVALCVGGTRVAVALGGADAVAVVDTTTLGVIATLPAGDQPLAVACAGGFLAVASYGDATVSVFDSTTLASLGSAPVGPFPGGVAIAGGRAWVTSLFDSTVTAVDLATATVTSTVPVGTAPRGIAAAAGRLFVGNVEDDTLTVLDAASGAVLGTVALPTAAPTDVATDATSGNVLVAHLGQPAISIVDPASLAVTGTVAAPVGLLSLAGVGLGGGVVPAEVPALGTLGLVVLATGLALLGLRWRGGLAVVLLAAIAHGSPASAQATTFTDTTFADADWQVFSVSPGLGSQNAGQSLFDGNPPPSRRMSHFQGPNETVRVVHRWVSASYDPSNSGAITSLSVSLDRRTCGGDPPVAQVLESFVLFQGGVAYSTPETAFSSPAWDTVTHNGLVASDFSDGAGGSPDFSTAGGPISFGYSRATISGAAALWVTCHGIDNLNVTVQTAPPVGSSSLGFAQRDYFPLEDEDLVVRVARSGDLTTPASIDVALSRELAGAVLRTVTWPAGTGGEATATFTPADFGGPGIAVRKLFFENPSAGVVIDPAHDKAMVYRGSDELGALWAVFAVLLARWDLAGLLLLALAATYVAVRRRAQQQAGDEAGERAVEVGVDRRRAAERGGARPQAPALGGELGREGGEQRHAGAAVATQRGDAAGREQAVEQGRESRHRGGARREQEHAERGAEPAGERGDRPAARAELAADGERHQRQTGEVPAEMRDAGVHDVHGQQPPHLAAQNGGAYEAESGEAAEARRCHQAAGERQDEEGGRPAHGAAASSHTSGARLITAGALPIPRLPRGTDRPRPRVALWLLLAAPALIASWGCVATGDVELHFKEARFNERISADLQGLSPQERNVDLRFGVFRDGSLDPDGSGPRTAGLVSEIYPVVASSSAGPGFLIQTPCLFSGRNGGNSDELRLNWEVVMKLDREADDYLKQALLEGYDEVGMCTFSSPATRVVFEDPSAPYPSSDDWGNEAKSCPAGVPMNMSSGGISFAWTVSEDPKQNLRNQPASCRFGQPLWTRLEAFLAPGPNPDAACPATAFTSGPILAPVYGCMGEDDLLPSCALPCGLQPDQDASYRVSIDPQAGLPAAERWLQPNVMVVDGQRPMVRRMDDPSASLAFAWQTKATRSGGMEGPVRWAENFSPTVRVETVQIVSRDAMGRDERVETPALSRLTVEVPRAGATAPTVLQCPGQVKPQGFTFAIADCRTTGDHPVALGPLTPTYLVENLHLAPAVEIPITWRATLSQLGGGRGAFIKFGLRAQTMGAALRVSAVHDFGRLPDKEYRQGVVELENVGGETVTVNTVDLVPGFGQPQDFSFFVVGDPVPMPLPFEAKARSDGSTSWTLGDLRDVPMVDVKSAGGGVVVTVGDPAAAPGQPQPFTLYGEGARLRGSVLTRDDANAVFVPPSGSLPRPLVLPAFAQQTPPFAVRPGERRQIVVEARPSALGVRQATLRVRGVPAGNPLLTLEVRSQLVVEVVSGPLLNYLPYSLYVYRDANGSQPGQRTALLENAGAVDMTVSSIRLTGAGAAHFALSTDHGSLGPFVLHSGEAALLRLEYFPECDGTYGTATSALDHEATITVTTNGGNAAIPVGGSSQGFCP